MITSSMEKPGFHINWTWLLKLAKQGGALAFAFALGGWIVSIRAQEASLPYKERSTVQLETIHKEVGKNPIATIKCERNRADVAEAVADQAVAVSNFAAVPNKLLDVIPDCPAAKTASVR
jgi:hypothetical protein